MLTRLEAAKSGGIWGRNIDRDIACSGINFSQANQVIVQCLLDRSVLVFANVDAKDP